MHRILLFLFCATVAHATVPPDQAGIIATLLADRKFAEAEAKTRALVAANPQSADAHALLGMVRFAMDDGEGAVKAWEQAVALAPNRSEYHRELGDAYGLAAPKAGMFSKIALGKKCLAAYERAVALDPLNLAARHSLMTACQQAPAVMGGGMDKAYAQAAAIKRLDLPRGHLAFATLHAGEKRFAEAFAELEEVLQSASDNYPALYQFGRTAALSGMHLDRGMDSLKRCLTLSPAPGSPGHESVHWRLGNLYELRGEADAARAAYQAALALKPDYQRALDSLQRLK